MEIDTYEAILVAGILDDLKKLPHCVREVQAGHVSEDHECLENLCVKLWEYVNNN